MPYFIWKKGISELRERLNTCVLFIHHLGGGKEGEGGKKRSYSRVAVAADRCSDERLDGCMGGATRVGGAT